MTSVDPSSLANQPLLAAIAWSYLAINSTRIVTYVPQIVAAWRCIDGARAISLFTWSSWTVSHISGLAYGTLVLHDVFFSVITAINLLGCLSVSTIVAMHRLRLRRNQSTALAARPAPRRLPAWSGATRLVAIACVASVALGTALWLPAHWQPLPPKAGAAQPMAALPPVGRLREDASLDIPYAALDLVTTLLARYDATRDQTALFEAMLVLDRQWDRPEVLGSGILQRVMQGYCPAEPMLRHFWLCHEGE